MSQWAHFDDEGRPRMVDITEKGVTRREAVASGMISLKSETFQMIVQKRVKKGDVLEVAKIAGILAAKRTSELIPMCHPISITFVDIFFHPNPTESAIAIESKVRTVGKTGVEMEALTAVSVAALTIYDMCKSVDRGMVISDIGLRKKSGGKSGNYDRGAI